MPNGYDQIKCKYSYLFPSVQCSISWKCLKSNFRLLLHDSVLGIELGRLGLSKFSLQCIIMIIIIIIIIITNICQSKEHN